ncbi:MAG: hypothetical protein NWF08_01880, partial [Candidatus Bathyarchaeota archaeon]|nr:hypothetical protein [Candidatus Bathyarchaeota archaeon]
PILSFLILMLWMGELVRLMRVSFYLKEREDLINLLLGSVLKSLENNVKIKKIDRYPKHFDKVIFWENYIRERIDRSSDKTRQLAFPYIAVYILFLSLSSISIIVSIIFPLRLLGVSIYIMMIAAITGFLIIMIVRCYLRRIDRRYKIDTII